MNLTIVKAFTEIECYTCSCLFAVSDEFYRNLKNNHNTFFCPNGHSQHFVGETDAERLRKQLAQETSRRCVAENQAFEASRKLKRLEKGVCSECNRTFTNLKRHMKTEHTAAKK